MGINPRAEDLDLEPTGVLIGVGVNGNLKSGGSAAARAVPEPPFVLKPGVAGVLNMVAPQRLTEEEGVEVENPRVGSGRARSRADEFWSLDKIFVVCFHLS